MNNAIIMHGLGRAITDPIVEKEVGIIYTLQVLLCSSLSGYHGMIHHHLTGFGVEHIPVHFKPAVSIYEQNCTL